MVMEKLWLSEAMLKKAENGEKLERGVLNIINSHAGSGKTQFIYKELLKNSKEYVSNLNWNYSYNLDKCMMVCDTSTLVDSNLLDEENKGRVKILKAGELSKSKKNYGFEKIIKNNGECGKMLVITYHTLGFLLENKDCENLIKDNFHLIIFDEIHNLFLYANKYDNDKNGYKYSRVIQNIKEMISNNILIIGLTATLVNTEHKLDMNGVKSRIIFNKEDLEKIICYEEGEKFYIKSAFNIIKEYILNKDEIFGKGEKLLIYTNKIDQADKYKQLFIKYGIKAEWLSSKNATEKDKITLRMNDYQIELRKQLLEGNDRIKRGILPKNIDVLIINAAYETGWNLYDDKIQHVVVDDIKDYTQIQARNRVRHDIKKLYIKGVYDIQPLWTESDFYNRCEYVGILGRYKLINNKGYSPRYRIGENTENYLYTPNLISKIDEKYFNIKLTDEIKDELVERYGVQYVDMKDEPKIKDVIKDINSRLEYIVHKNKKGTWIFKTNEIKEYMINNNIEKYSEIVGEQYRKNLNKKNKIIKRKEDKPSKKQKERSDLKVKSKQLKEEGKSIREIANILGVSKSTVGRWIKE